MRTLTLVLLGILFSGCATRDSTSDFVDCDASSDVSVSLALNVPGVGMESAMEDQFTVVVGVDNNSELPIDVVAIRIDPGQGVHPRYRISNSYREFNRTVPPRGDSDFELPVSGRGMGLNTAMSGRATDDFIPVIVSVYLRNGVAYRCTYDVPAPRV